MRITTRLATLLCLTLLAACGNKGPVRPLETSTPNTIQAPELRQQGEALLLGWQLPTTNQDGSPLRQAPLVDIYRMTYDPQDDCPECFDRSTLLASINPQRPEPAQRVGERFLFHDHALQVGVGYQYKLLVRNDAGEQSRPLILRQDYLEPVPAPQQVTVTPRDRSVTLQWQLPPLHPEDALIGYLVYRSLDSGGSPYPLNQQPLSETIFEDFSLDNGTRYYYQVRALVKRGKHQLEGRASKKLSATPKAGI